MASFQTLQLVYTALGDITNSHFPNHHPCFKQDILQFWQRYVPFPDNIKSF